MFQIPRAPLVLGLAGLLPFIFGALIATGAFIADMGNPDIGGYPLIVAADGLKAMERYGIVILSFMSGVLWGFATNAEQPRATTGYVLSVLPALWAFGIAGGTQHEILVNLMIGFTGLLLLDGLFTRWGLTPPWWMHLRLILTAIVVICLAIGAFA